MKKQTNLTTRCLAIAVAAGAFALANSAFAQAVEGTPRTSKPAGTMGAPGAADREKSVTTGPSDASTGAVDPATGNVQRKGASGPLSGTGTNTGLSAMDKQFMMTAAKDGMREVHMGQMAVQQGQSAEVKKLGNMIVTDHTKANGQLMEIATRRGVKPDLRHRMDKMSKKEMANFDQAWLAMMVNDHQKDIALYQTQAQQGADPDLKAFAKKTLPVLQKHLKAVQSAQKKMGGATTSGSTAKTGS
jgi:putative membrane protein